jgi:hypothetical protein
MSNPKTAKEFNHVIETIEEIERLLPTTAMINYFYSTDEARKKEIEIRELLLKSNIYNKEIDPIKYAIAINMVELDKLKKTIKSIIMEMTIKEPPNEKKIEDFIDKIDIEKIPEEMEKIGMERIIDDEKKID